MPSDAPTAFFSYSRDDSEFALKLAEDLKAAGANVWLDQLDITPGDRWDRQVEVALNECPCLLVILSPASVGSNNVLDEVSFALDKRKTVIPVLYRDCEIPFRIRRLQYIDSRRDNPKAVQQLLRKLNGLSGKNTATPTADQKEIDGDVVREQQPDSDGGGESIRWSPTAQKRFRFPLPVWVVGGLSIVALTIASVFYVKLQGNHTAVTQKANAAVNNPSPAGTSPVIRNIEPPRLIKPSERPQRATVVDFQNLPGESGSRFTSYSEAGITVKTESGKWLVEKRGSAPYIYFLLPRESHAEAKATILVTAGGLPFSFSSADFYSSVTTIPYILTGKMAGQTVFLQSGIVPNTFGNFASIEVEDKYKAITVDMLEIQLSTFTEYAVGNPVGINNIILLMKG